MSLTPSVAKALALSACWRALSARRLWIRHRERAGRSGIAIARGSEAAEFAAILGSRLQSRSRSVHGCGAVRCHCALEL